MPFDSLKNILVGLLEHFHPYLQKVSDVSTFSFLCYCCREFRM